MRKGTQRKEEWEAMPGDRLSLLHEKPGRGAEGVSTGYLGGLPIGRNGVLHQFREGREEEGIYRPGFLPSPISQMLPQEH